MVNVVTSCNDMGVICMLKYASISRRGSRKYNEDFLQIASVSNHHCFVVCDGLGGHEFGDVAAQIAGSTFANELYYCKDICKFLENTFVKAQERLISKQNEKDANSEMKTTVVCMVTDGENGYVGHIGDSRFYGFTNNDTYVRTLDHSIPQILVQTKLIDETQIRNHPSRNMLLKVMGDQWDEPLYELREPFLLQDYRAFLLCTDGFWELITEDEMLSTLSKSISPKEWLDKMVDIVELKGSMRKMDNYSAIAIYYMM